MLKKGFPTNCVSLIYGEASTGKTTFVMQSSVKIAKKGLKVLYIDADHSFSSQRLLQIANFDLHGIGERIIIFSPKDFDEQSKLIENLESYITKNVRLVVLDGFTSLYRQSLESINRTFSLNRELNRQLAYLAELAINHRLAILMTSQIHSVFNGENWRIEPVAYRILLHWSKVILSLKPTSKSNVKKAVIERHIKDEEKKQICFLTIYKNGLRILNKYNA